MFVPSTATLQWGHALEGVDGDYEGLVALQGELLQWGHALEGVDERMLALVRLTPVLVLQWGHALEGVDGPRKGAPSGYCRARLQWGHALEGVDGRMARSHPISRTRCFNGATPWRAWMVSDLMLLAGKLCKLQWGHALEGVDEVATATVYRA